MHPSQLYPSTHPDYPEALTRLTQPPAFTATGPIPKARAVAIVGSREAFHECAEFAYGLARDLAKAGITIVSGGATGIDAAAHRGALEAGGATWVVCPTGKNHVAPAQHGRLFREIARSKNGRLIWPFADDAKAETDNYRARNGILVQLSEAVVVIQAGLKSGSRNACSWARHLRRPLWVVPGPPWGEWAAKFAGSNEVLATEPNARMLGSRAQLFESLGLAPAVGRRRSKRPSSSPEQQILSPLLGATPDPTWTPEENAMFLATLAIPQHREILAEKAALPIGSAITALLTLTLKDVVVEGPDGFFRRTLAS